MGVGATTAGSLLLIGGHEAPRGAILAAFVDLAGSAPEIALLTLATQEPEEAYRRYRASFEQLGARAVRHLPAAARADCHDPEGVQSLREADGIFFSGGDQLRITSVLGGTPYEAAVRAAHHRGAVVGGTSAGASAMSATMLVGGADEESARRADVRMCPGLGLLPNAVVDQHFAQRGRINRLLAALAQNPGTLGIGIDEDTAVLVRGDELKVLGSGTATVLDARGAIYGDASEAGVDAPLRLGPVRLWVLPASSRFDLERREPAHRGDARGEHSGVPVLR